LITALPEVMRVLTSPADTGTAVLALPQDVQAEAFDFPEELFEKRVWTVQRPRPDASLVHRAVEWINASRKPLIVSGGGTIYSGAENALAAFMAATGMPLAETFAGKGVVPYTTPGNLGAVGATGTPGAAAMAADADLVIGIGTRYSDFTTASKTAFQHPDVRFININVAAFDAFKHAALPLVSDARVCLEELHAALGGYKADAGWTKAAGEHQASWDATVTEIYRETKQIPATQAEVVGAVNTFSGPKDVVLCAAGSLPGDLHKLWRTRDSKGFHLEYGYSTMGYEIAAGLGAKMACPDREIYVMVGDGNYLMNNHEIITAVQEHVKMVIILLDNHGFKSIGSLSEAVGSQRFGTNYRYRNDAGGGLDGANLPVDFAMNARSLGAHVIEVADIASLKRALQDTRSIDKTTVIVIETDGVKGIEGYAWWEVAVAEVSEMPSVQKAREEYVAHKKKQRYYL
jgi:3D-(3,5/4)-trihydroxycyclohexane-1,2-dione acylhydrolase (decyclizing)